MARDGHQRMQLSRLDEAKKKPRRSKRTPGLLARSGGLGVSQLYDFVLYTVALLRRVGDVPTEEEPLDPHARSAKN